MRDHPVTPHPKRVRISTTICLYAKVDLEEAFRSRSVKVETLMLLQRLQSGQRKEGSCGGQKGADMMLQICSAEL
jgi:hypothetical protein